MVKIKFGGWVPNCHCKNISRFKFGGSLYGIAICIYARKKFGRFTEMKVSHKLMTLCFCFVVMVRDTIRLPTFLWILKSRQGFIQDVSFGVWE